MQWPPTGSIAATSSGSGSGTSTWQLVQTVTVGVGIGVWDASGAACAVVAVQRRAGCAEHVAALRHRLQAGWLEHGRHAVHHRSGTKQDVSRRHLHGDRGLVCAEHLVSVCAARCALIALGPALGAGRGAREHVDGVPVGLADHSGQLVVSGRLRLGLRLRPHLRRAAREPVSHRARLHRGHDLLRLPRYQAVAEPLRADDARHGADRQHDVDRWLRHQQRPGDADQQREPHRGRRRRSSRSTTRRRRMFTPSIRRRRSRASRASATPAVRS